MYTITVRNVPATTIKALKLRAKRHGRSMEQEVREMLGDHVAERRAVLDEIERMVRSEEPIPVEEIERWMNEKHS